jgi:SAM-dependent methyltransferase
MRDVARCDLCGSGESAALIDSATQRALRSDRIVVPMSLRKLECRNCGLVRDGSAYDPAAGRMYESAYQLTLDEHQFYTPEGLRPRSAVFADWIAEVVGAAPLAGVARALEVGAGSGLLTAEIAKRMPNAEVNGIELGAEAVAEAARLGRAVTAMRIEDVPAGAYDLVYAIAVLEHVPSPSNFLMEIRRVLTPGGLAVLAQPTQDVESYDVFFVDHLHHFGAGHLAAYAEKSGLKEIARRVGHPQMPNFSIHVLKAGERPATWNWRGGPWRTRCDATAARVTADMRALDTLLDRLAADRRGLAVFGIHEVFALASAYSALGDAAIRCGLDDQPARAARESHPFPVVIPEACVEYGIDDVLLTMNKLYYPHASARIEQLGVSAHPVLS